MVLDKLGESLRNSLQKIAKSVFVDDKLINELIKDIQRSLLQSDANVQLVFDLTNGIKERAKNEKPPAGITQKEHLINIVYEELVKFVGEKEAKIDTSKKPTKIMLIGLFGSGKTTTAGKLAKYFTKRGQKVAMIQLDTMRPAALEQLEQLGEKSNATVFGEAKEKDPLKVYKTFEKELKKFDVVIVDTAGRDALSDDLIDELNNINKAVQPSERLLVISADIGQAAEKQATAFHDTCKVTGIFISKMEGTAKGGGALIASSVTDAPVKFIGVGEKIDDLERFNPPGFIGRLLGMGDLEALLEKAQEAVTVEEAQDIEKKFLKGDFNLEDLYQQMQAMKKMGPLSKITQLIPGFSQLKLPKDVLNVQEGKLEKWKFMMDSMTKEELENPDSISPERIERVAKGSGTTPSDVRELLKQYKQSKKMFKMLKGGDMKSMEKMMKKAQGMQKVKFK